MKSFKKLSKASGRIPGELIHVGEKKTDKIKITVIDYNEQKLQEKEFDSIEECFPFNDTPTVTWINIDGIHDTQIIEKLGGRFELHQLVMEDILNTSQRPKYEDFDKHLFVVLKMIRFDEKTARIVSEQVSLILGDNFVISFQEVEGDVFDPVRKRIRSASGRIRKLGADYLAYSLLDSVVDSYYSILEKIGERIESVEEELLSNPTPQTLQIMHNLKRDVISLRRSIWPLREVVNNLERGESKLIKKTTHIFLRDAYDHTIQVIDTIETFRDMISGMLDVYLSSVSNKMNEVMKVLTIIATIFIPITFIAGIYGMNFKYMPELNWSLGYVFAWGVIFLIVLVMLVFFKRKKWF